VHVPQPEHHCDSVLTIRNRVGVGLAGMRERMNELNGKLEIESGGTELWGLAPSDTGQGNSTSQAARFAQLALLSNVPTNNSHTKSEGYLQTGDRSPGLYVLLRNPFSS
jgi:hypothetical protein